MLPRPLQKFLCDINQLNEACSVAVLASGDPLFYGIGSTLIRALGRDRVEVWPALSSVQLAFARAGEAWQQARLLSVHGRPLTGLAQRVHGAKSVALLTDGIHTPNAIAKYLLHFEMTEYDMFVAERLGSPEETCAWYSLAEAADAVFDPLNVVILSRRADASAPSFHLGVDDAKFAQRKPDRGLITKREVRIVSLSELRLRAGDVLWDIGACTGSVGIEAILQQPEVEVYAVEKNAEDLENLRVNQITFRTDFVAVHAKAPAGLDQFPDPDAVFIGGSGGELRNCSTCVQRG
ncbi:hypothetical protein GCM10025857_01220 [Alicyclobacillus contaminans]|nr:hypothetical protein GCM10025857_01220 [Alicyclobacillus contaminans]